jgi:hypothetical protein
MNKDEALNMAIEAMDYLSAVVQRQLSTKSKQEYSLVLYKDAINACKEALEQNDNLLTIAYMSGVAEGKSKALEALKMAGYELDGVIADVEKFDGFDDVCLQTIKRVRSTIEEALATNKESSLVQPAQEHNFCSRCGKRASKDLNQIHTCTPPQALEQPAWQGLTADELEDIKDNSKEGWYQLVRNVEQALKEKNHG